MKNTKIILQGATLSRAVLAMTVQDELWRAAWSSDGLSDDFHIPLRLEQCSARLLSVHGNQWSACSLTKTDILARDWQLRRIIQKENQ